MKNLVSVIVPVYNSEKYLEECIESILNQTYTNIELLLVDDGSTDDSGIICKRYSKWDERVSYYYEENGGVSSARNNGLSNSKGKYVVFVDSDDVIGKRAIENLINMNSSNCMPRMKLYAEKSGYYEREEYLQKIIKGDILGRCCGILFNRVLLEGLRFDEKTGYLEDTIFLFKYVMNNKLKTVYFCEHDDDVMYLYRQNPEGITGHLGYVLPRLKDIEYSLNQLNEITYGKYKELLEVKKIALLEENFKLITDKQEIKRIFREIHLEKYSGTVFKYKLFVWLYSGKHYMLIYLYYKLRKIRQLIVQGKGEKE